MSDFNASGSTSIFYRIRIGVTGARSAENLESLADGLRSVLRDSPEHSRILELFGPEHRKLMDSIKHTRIAFTLLTTFEEGVDRLAVPEISKLAGSRIQIILPYPEKDYERGFSSESSKADFRELLKNERLVRVPTLLQKDASDRKGALIRAHRYIVDHCDVVLAVGETGDGENDFLPYAKAKQRPVIRIRNASDITMEKGYGLNAKSLQRLEQYNKSSVSNSSIKKESESVYRDVFHQAGDRISESTKEMIRAVMAPHYARASVIALSYQRYYQWAGILVYALSALAVVSVAIGVIRDIHTAYGVEFLFLAVILIAVLLSESRGAHKNWIETRFLAERIRSSMFLASCGVEASPIYLPPYMGAAHRQDDWMVMAFQDIWERMPTMRGCSGEQCVLLSEFVRTSWLDDQIEYHRQKAKLSHKIGHAMEVAGRVLFAAALIVSALHVLLPLKNKFAWEQFLVFLALCLPAVAAALEGIRKHNEYSRLATLSENMEEALEELKQRYEEVRSNDSLDSLMRETDELMLRETQGWLMLMRFVKLEPVL